MYQKRQGGQQQTELKPDVALAYVSAYQDKQTGARKNRIVIRIKADLLPQANQDGIIELVGFEPKTKTDKSPTFKLNPNKPLASAGKKVYRQAANPKPINHAIDNDDDVIL